MNATAADLDRRTSGRILGSEVTGARSSFALRQLLRVLALWMLPMPSKSDLIHDWVSLDWLIPPGDTLEVTHRDFLTASGQLLERLQHLTRREPRRVDHASRVPAEGHRRGLPRSAEDCDDLPRMHAKGATEQGSIKPSSSSRWVAACYQPTSD